MRATLTHVRTGANFRVSATHAAHAALATVTVMGAVVYIWAVRCPPPCNRVVMGVPGSGTFVVRHVESNADASGRGPVAVCKRCGQLVEVIQHREAA